MFYGMQTPSLTLALTLPVQKSLLRAALTRALPCARQAPGTGVPEDRLLDDWTQEEVWAWLLTQNLDWITDYKERLKGTNGHLFASLTNQVRDFGT